MKKWKNSTVQSAIVETTEVEVPRHGTAAVVNAGVAI